MAKGRPTGARIKRRPGMMYFVDKNGEVREIKRSTGGKRGRRSCWPRKGHPGPSVETAKRRSRRSRGPGWGPGGSYRKT